MLGILADPHQLHRPHKGQVVRHNLSQLGKMPPVPDKFSTLVIIRIIFISYFPKVKEKYLPFSTAHNVIVQLFVQIVEERHSLNQSES